MSSSIIDALSEDNQARVANILESCLFALEHGERLSPEELIQANPDLAEPLGKCLTTLMSLHAAVHGGVDTSSDNLPAAGTRLGDYVLEAQIGRGGMGVVYRAKQISLDRTVALKLLPNSHLLSPHQLKRFTLESRAVAQLQHANIVPVFAVGAENKIHYFAMQLIQGCTLDKVDYRTWSSHGFRPLLDAAIDLADALSHAHKSGIIHRDVKPGNILMDEKGKVWITDFGLALCKSDSRLTMTGDLVGTMNYMSPEQAEGKPLDERTDIFSLGVTLYELITGQAAFPGQVRPEVLRAIECVEPAAPRKLNRDCPYDLETIILKALSKNRDDRYASAAELRDDLGRLRDGQSITGRRPSHLHRAVRWAQRHRGLAAVAVIGLLATCLSTTVGATVVLLTRNQLRQSQVESQTNLSLAEDNYWQGRNLVMRWNQDVVTRLADIPGAESLHANMLADTIEYYQAFLNQAQAPAVGKQTLDPALKKDMAAARLALASAFDARGQADQAIETYRQAIRDLEILQLDQDLQEDRTIAKRRAIAQNDLAVVLLRVGQAENAHQQLNAALEELTRSTSSDGDLLAAIHANLARAHQAAGDLAAEAAQLAEAERLYRDALKRDQNAQDKAAVQSELAAVLDWQVLRLASQKSPASVQLGEQAIALHQAACAVAGAPLGWRTRLAASQHNLGVILLEMAQADRARRLFQQAIATKLDVGKRTGLRPGSGADAATSYLALGRLECGQGQVSAALECFQQAIAACKHDVAVRPSQENQLQLAESLVSYFRLSHDDQSRLECQRVLKAMEGTSLTDAQSKLVQHLTSLINSTHPPEARPSMPAEVSPVMPTEVSPTSVDRQGSDPLSENT